jgi:hypothetical protein
MVVVKLSSSLHAREQRTQKHTRPELGKADEKRRVQENVLKDEP